LCCVLQRYLESALKQCASSWRLLIFNNAFILLVARCWISHQRKASDVAVLECIAAEVANKPTGPDTRISAYILAQKRRWKAPNLRLLLEVHVLIVVRNQML